MLEVVRWVSYCWKASTYVGTTILALPGQNDQFPWPEKNSVEPKRCDGKQWIFKGKIAFFLVFIMLAMEIM